VLGALRLTQALLSSLLSAEIHSNLLWCDRPSYRSIPSSKFSTQSLGRALECSNPSIEFPTHRLSMRNADPPAETSARAAAADGEEEDHVAGLQPRAWPDDRAKFPLPSLQAEAHL